MPRRKEHWGGDRKEGRTDGDLQTMENGLRRLGGRLDSADESTRRRRLNKTSPEHAHLRRELNIHQCSFALSISNPDNLIAVLFSKPYVTCQ